MTVTRIVLCVGLVFSVVLHLQGDQPTTTGPDAVAYLSTEEAARVDAVIGDYVSVTQARIVANLYLEKNIALLKAGEKGDFSWIPPMRIGFCAKECRDAFVPIPESIDDSVVDAIVALDDDAVGTTRENRRYIRDEAARALGFIGNKRALDTVLHIIETQEGSFAWNGLPDIADERIIPFIREHFAFSPPP